MSVARAARVEGIPDEESCAGRRAQVLSALERLGPSTAERIADSIPAPTYTIRPRITELVKAGQVIEAGYRSEDSTGKRNTVWTLRPRPLAQGTLW